VDGRVAVLIVVIVHAVVLAATNERTCVTVNKAIVPNVPSTHLVIQIYGLDCLLDVLRAVALGVPNILE
jgi:hypothetical protein